MAEAAEEYGVPGSGLFANYDLFLDVPLDVVVVGTPIQFRAEQASKANVRPPNGAIRATDVTVPASSPTKPR